MPERILLSRCYLRKKPVDNADAKQKMEFAFPFNSDFEGGSKRWSIAKCRWINVGFDDPGILALETSSPAPQLPSISVFAVLRREIGLGDLEAAFFQGKTQREQLLRLEVEVYGTVRSSANWRETIRQFILSWVTPRHVRTRDPRTASKFFQRHRCFFSSVASFFSVAFV